MRGIIKIFAAFALLLITICLGMFLKVHTVPETIGSVETKDVIKSVKMFNTDESAFSVLVNTEAELTDKETTLKKNKDAVGWVNIEDVIDLPVMVSDAKYSNHDYCGNVSTQGCVVMQESENGDKFVLCISCMNDNSDLLKNVIQYSKKEFALKHNSCIFSSKKVDTNYKLLAVYYESKNKPTITSSFKNEKEFNRYVTSVYKASGFVCVKKQPSVKQLFVIKSLDSKNRILNVIFYR